MPSLRSVKLNNAYQSLNISHQKLFMLIYDYIYQNIYKEIKEKNSLHGFSSIFYYSDLLNYANKNGFDEDIFQAVMKTLEQNGIISYSKTKNIVKIWEEFIQTGGGRGARQGMYQIWTPDQGSSPILWAEYNKAGPMSGGYIHEWTTDGGNFVKRSEVKKISYIGGAALERQLPIQGVTYEDRFWNSHNELMIDNNLGGFPADGWVKSRNIKDRPHISYTNRIFPKPTTTNGCITHNTDIEYYSNIPGNNIKCAINLEKSSPLTAAESGKFRLITAVEVATIAPKTTAATYQTIVTTIPTPITTITTLPVSQTLRCPAPTDIPDAVMLSVNSNKCAECPRPSNSATLNTGGITATCLYTDRLSTYVVLWNAKLRDKII